MTTGEGQPLREYPLLPQSEHFAFLETGPEHTPASGYAEYVRRREGAGLPAPRLYISTTITTGGYRRQEDRSVGEAIAANSRFARALTQEGLLEHGFDPAAIVLPSELGKVPGWKQTDYLQFWLYIIRAVEPGAAGQLESEHFASHQSVLPAIGERMESAPTYDERRSAYIDFVKEYHRLRRDPVAGVLLQPHWKAPVVLPGLDNSLSLGCSAEYYFAEAVLPEWYADWTDASTARTAASLRSMGAMVAGVTQELLDERAASSAARYADYYAHKT